MSLSSHILHNEKNLLIQIANDDEDAFTKIFFHYLPRTQPFILKITKSKEVTEEIIHDVFLSIWMNRKKILEIDNFQAYIFTAAANKTFTYLKKLSKERKKIISINLTEESNITEESINLKESTELVKQAVAHLPPQRRLIFKLSREEGLSHDEISEHLNISKNTVKNQIVQALQFIKDYLQNSSALPIILTIGCLAFIQLFY